ncbi:MAG: GNAT family N-acetyltransferase [Syntrophothermus sp.]
MNSLPMDDQRLTQPASFPKILCRPAAQDDREDVLEFCKGIWEGEDYIHLVWDDWFQDPDGLLAVAEYEGHAIGCSKISRISSGQWWLEGFRVDPKYQGLKVGTQLHSHVTQWWLANGEGILRLMTDAGNFAVHHLCDQTGYTKIGEVCGYRAVPLEEPTDSFSPVIETEEAAAFALESDSIKATGGLTDLGWRICKPDQQVFKTYTNQNPEYIHNFYWWKDHQGLFSAWEEEDNGRRTLFLGIVACALSDMPRLLTAIRRFAADKNCHSIFQIAFDLPQITSRLLAAGFEKRWKRSNAFVFEKIHPGRA